MADEFGTEVRYNGSRLKDCQTLRFSQEVVMDESDTDLLMHKITIRVASNIHEKGFDDSLGIHVGNEQNPLRAAAIIRGYLLHPRGVFQYRIGGVVLVQAQPVQGRVDTDLNNGPRPLSCDVTYIAGISAFRIEFEIEVHLLTCFFEDVVTAPNQAFGAQGAGKSKEVLSNKWSLQDGVDENMYRDRTWSGVLRVSHSHYIPHGYRHLVIPPLQRGYKRTTMRFIQSPNGLSLRYEIVDRQKYAKPPAPAIDWKATYTEATGMAGAQGHASINIMMMGPPNGNRRDLLIPAHQVMLAKIGDPLRGFHSDGEHQIILTGGAVVEHLDTNMIELRVQILRPALPERSVFANMVVGRLGAELPDVDGYDPKDWPAPIPYDSRSPAASYATYLQHPCNPLHGISQIAELPLSGDQVVGQADFDAEDGEYFETDEEVELDEDEGLSEAQKGNFPYTFLKMQNRYMIRNGSILLPMASTNISDNEPSSEVIELHKPVARRVYEIHAERAGKWPQLPRFDKDGTDSNEINERLEDVTFIPDPPSLMPDGKTLLYSGQARYVYLLDRSPTNEETFRVGSPMWDATTKQQNEFLASENLIDPNQIT